MKRTRNRRGGALILAMMLSALLAFLAESLVTLAYSRIRAYSRHRVSVRSALAARAAYSDLNVCVDSAPGAVCAPGWTAWACAGRICRAERNYTTSEGVYKAVATIDGATVSLGVDAP